MIPAFRCKVFGARHLAVCTQMLKVLELIPSDTQRGREGQIEKTERERKGKDNFKLLASSMC